MIGSACLTLACSLPAAQQPDLVVILADDMGAETVGCYGSEDYQTPALDRLAREGVRMSAAFTQPLCTPTRVELLTGRSNARNYRAFSVLDPAERTFAHELRDAGYRTFLAGKWQLLAAEHYPEEIRGSGTRPEQAGFEHHALWQVEELGSRHWGPKLVIDGETKRFDQARFGPDVALEHGLRWMEEAGEDPFLFYWPMILPHDPFIAPPGTEGARKGSDPELYRPMVEYVDTLVGRLMEVLRSRKRDCMVIFLGDNGSPRSTRSRCNGVEVPGGKREPNHYGSWVPFLMWWPSQLPADYVFGQPVCSVDVFATLLDAAGMEMPDRRFDGWSLLPTLQGDRAVHREWVTFHFHPRPQTRKDPALRWARDRSWQLFEDGRFFHVASDPLLESPLTKQDLQATSVARAHQSLQTALHTLPPAGQAQYPAPRRP